MKRVRESCTQLQWVLFGGSILYTIIFDTISGIQNSIVLLYNTTTTVFALNFQYGFLPHSDRHWDVGQTGVCCLNESIHFSWALLHDSALKQGHTWVGGCLALANCHFKHHLTPQTRERKRKGKEEGIESIHMWASEGNRRGMSVDKWRWRDETDCFISGLALKCIELDCGLC